MEFLRFGSSIPGAYWGCCACCIIQNFKFDPDDKASIQLVSGDGGQALGDLFVGPTYRDIFLSRIRFGTFDKRDMPNHAFFAILTENQIKNKGSVGYKWLQILKENGFEFIRTVSNSVYAGQNVCKPGSFGDPSKNYIFGLIRNIGTGAVSDPFTPPKAWTDLPQVVTEAWSLMTRPDDLPTLQQTEQLAIWQNLPKPKFLTRQEVIDAGAPVVLAGQRSLYPQQPEEMRNAVKQKEEEAKGKLVTDVFASVAPAPAPVPAAL